MSALLEGKPPPASETHSPPKITAAGFTLDRASIDGGANGTTNYGSREVTVADSLSPVQAVKTLAHELAHVHLHDGTEYATGCRGRAEVGAESVAYSLIWTGGPR